MVKHVSIQNFKSIKSLEFEAKRVNVFVGEPNAGKSNILEALGIFSVFSTTNGISEIKTTLRFKTSDDLFFDNDVSKPIMIICDNYRAVCSEGDLNVNFKVVYDNPNDPIFYGNLEISNEGIYSGRINNDMSPFKFYKFQVEENLNDGSRLYLQPPTGKNLFYVLKTNSALRSACNEMLVSKGYRLGLRMKTGEIEVLRDTGEEIIQYPYQTLSDTLQRIIDTCFSW